MKTERGKAPKNSEFDCGWRIEGMRSAVLASGLDLARSSQRQILGIDFLRTVLQAQVSCV